MVNAELEQAIMAMLKKYFTRYDVGDLQKRSYNYFITHRLARIIEEEPYIEVALKKNEFFRVEFGQVFVDRPYIVDEKRTIQYIVPSEALMRDITYSSMLSINIITKHFTVDENECETILEEKSHVKIPFARIPMMVGCCKCNLYPLSPAQRKEKGHCENDPGGYFIIKGKERVLVAQERINYNIVYVFEKKSSDQKHVMVSEIRSMSEETGHSVLVQMKISSNLRIMVNLPFIAQEIPLGFVFMAYGCSMEKIETVLQRNLMNLPDARTLIQGVMKDAMIIKNEENAIHHIAQFATHVVAKDRRYPYVKQILMNEVFPHLGISSDETQKIIFLGHMCGKLILTYVGHRPMDDRDHLSNKRVEVAGILVGDLFRTLWKRFIRTIIPQLTKRLDILTIISKLNIITMGLRHCFSTGNWGIPKSNYIRTGVSQVLSRMSFNSTLSHLRRIVIPIGKEGRNTKIRQVHPTQIGFICSSETPEGSSAGIVKNFSLISEISLYFDPVIMRMILEKLPGIVTDYSQFLLHEQWIKIFLNGNLIGIVPGEDVEGTHRSLEHMKYVLKLIPSTVSLTKEENEIRIFCDEGRMIRPFFNAQNMPPTETVREGDWDDMVRKGYIVWMDSHELEQKYVSMFPHELVPEHDLCEIHPCLMLGICASLMPFADHTQSPRICYHSSMVKQSIGIYSSTNEIRCDTVSHILANPEKPIVRSHVEEWFKLDKLPCGNNVIVAIACYGGWNQEDSIILNKSSVDRGLFRSFSYRTLMVEEKKKTSAHIETIGMPPLDIRIRSFNYSKLSASGIVRPGIFVGSGDVVVAKISVRQVKMGRDEKADTSIVIRNGEEGHVDKVFVTTTPDGYKMVKIKIRCLKIPEIGDKLCSNCAQKGTIGMTLRTEDMPFTPDGIVPDIIINPLCIPSRMTINQLMECIGAKSAVTMGKFRYATTFSSHSANIVDVLKDELKQCGYEKNGNEFMINGITGKPMDAEIFIGPSYYHRLKHLVSAKIHARNHGKVSQLTHQPLEGRSRDGGLRFGEMERDTIYGEAEISLQCGLSIKLKTMVESGWDVLGWSSERDGLIAKKQTAFLDKGEKECVEVVLEDGRKIKCTPDHPMLTSENQWVRAKDLVVGTTRLKAGVHYPLMEMQEEIAECAGWSLAVGGLFFKVDSVESFLEAMALMRIVGLLITDGGIYQTATGMTARLSVGHELDVQNVLKDLNYFCQAEAKFNTNDCAYSIRIPADLTHHLIHLRGVVVGRKVNQCASLPEFVLDPKFPRPLLREFLGGMFGGDGHTCVLTMHRGKRDVLTSIAYSKSRTKTCLESLTKMMEDITMLLNRFGIHNITLQKLKETSHSKANCEGVEKCYQSTLHLDLTELRNFHEKIGFRYCCHKSQRLEAGVAYKRFRDEVTRQHNWITNRVDEITDFSKIKKENPTKIVGTKKAIIQATEELMKIEPLIHEYAIPSTHDITDHLIKGTQFGKFTSKSFPNAEEFMIKIGAIQWFVGKDELKTCYAVPRDMEHLSTMNLTVLDVRPCAPEKVYDIEVEEINSFLANGIVAHNCMISHGNSRFLLERLFDMSDPFRIPICSDCGAMPSSNTYCSVCEGNNVVIIPMPYACKLLFQELNAMGIRINLFPEKDCARSSSLLALQSKESTTTS